MKHNAIRYTKPELEGVAREIQKHAKTIGEMADLVDALMEQDHVEARLAAEHERDDLKREVDTLRDQLATVQARNRRQVAQLQAARVALNGRGRGYVPDIALEVFNALKEVAPNHPLVTYRPKDG